MIHGLLVICVFVGVGMATSAVAQTTQRSAFTPGEIWPDDKGTHINAHGGGILFHDGVYYWFGEHKVAGRRGNSAQVGVSVYSSTDLYNWKDEGIALAVSVDPASPITRGCVLERPKVVYNAKSKKFVMWFHLELKGQGYTAAQAGVAVADKVTGPYEFKGAFRPNAGIWPINIPEDQKFVPEDPKQRKYFQRDFERGQMARDQTVFVDDDGAAYHLFASEENGTMHISQLTDDYTAPAGKWMRIFPDRMNEAPAIFKRGGRYWMITSGCTGWNPNAARLGVADSIWGPWKELPNPCRGADRNLTFHSQSTWILPVQGKKDAFIFMADRWAPQDAIDGRYLWLPIEFDPNGTPYLEWKDQWDLSVFK